MKATSLHKWTWSSGAKATSGNNFNQALMTNRKYFVCMKTKKNVVLKNHVKTNGQWLIIL